MDTVSASTEKKNGEGSVSWDGLQLDARIEGGQTKEHFWKTKLIAIYHGKGWSLYRFGTQWCEFHVPVSEINKYSI